MNSTIFSVVPRLPPAICGTGTYGWTLTQHWPEPKPRFVHVVVDGAEASRRQLGADDIFEIGHSASRLCKAMESLPGADAIVHYASRGYHRYGFPWWIGSGMVRWRRRNPKARLLVYFHEVPRQLPMRSRFGIIEWINRRIMRRLARVASVILTNTPEHARRLEDLSGRCSVEWLPVPSNISTPPNPDSSFASRRQGDFVIFGLPFTQLLTVQAFGKDFAAWRAAGILERLHLIGPEDTKFSPQASARLRQLLPSGCIVQHGILEPPAVSALLQTAGFFLTQSTADNFSKSTTLMAFAAHGCAIVARMESAPTTAPFRDFILPGDLLRAGASKDFSVIEHKSRSLREWYQQTACWPVIARRVYVAFRGSQSPDMSPAY